MKNKEKTIEEGKFFAVISYVGFLCVVSLLLKKDNEFVLFHAKQGLVLFVAEAVVFVVSVIPLLGWLLGILGFLCFSALSVWGVIEALKGNVFRLPLVSDIADKIVL